MWHISLRASPVDIGQALIMTGDDGQLSDASLVYGSESKGCSTHPTPIDILPQTF